MLVDFIAPLTIGFMGSLHCLGMCGPIVVACFITPAWSCKTDESSLLASLAPDIRQQLVFHLGRLATYGMLGSLAAGLFQAAEIGRMIFNYGSILNFVGGLLLLFLGLTLLKIFPVPACMKRITAAPAFFLAGRLRPLFRSRRLASRLCLGMAVGLLPCCLSWAMILTAASTQDPVRGFGVMAAFWLGTTPSLFPIGLSSSFLSLRIRAYGEKAAALSIMIMGVVLLSRGVGILA